MPVKPFAPLFFSATPAAVRAFGSRLPEIAREAFLEIGRKARGYAIHHHQFRLATGELVAVARTFRSDPDAGSEGLGRKGKAGANRGDAERLQN